MGACNINVSNNVALNVPALLFSTNRNVNASLAENLAVFI